MIEKLPEFNFISKTTLIVVLSYIVIALIYYFVRKNKEKKIISTLISFIIIASCSTLYTYHHYTWNTVALSDIKDNLEINKDIIKIKPLSKNIRYKDNSYDKSKEQQFKLSSKDDKYYLINENSNTGYELTEKEYNKLKGEN